MAQKRDYYEVLGVDKKASADEIKSAYRKLALKWHPDRWVNGTDAEKKTAEDNFKEAAEAYSILSDPDKRAKYDQFGFAAEQMGGGAGGFDFGGMDINDFLRNIFGGSFGFDFGGFGGRNPRNQNAPRKGSDVEATVTLSFEEAAKGCKKEVTYQNVESCKACNGTGASEGTNMKTCPDCNGKGQVTTQKRTPFGVVQTSQVCEKCRGKGKVIEKPCPKCSGVGRVRSQRTISVTFPAGISQDVIRNISGHGNSGYNGGPAGDLHIYVNVKKHEIFERKGDDVWCEIPLTFTQAALGHEVIVPTLDGKASYQVHPGTQPGDIFKLKGKGIQHLNAKGRGDQYVRVTVEVPRNLTEEQKKYLKEFDRSCTTKNYQKRSSFFDKVKNLFRD